MGNGVLTSEVVNSAGSNERVLMPQILEGLRKNEFTFFLQPRYELNARRVIGAEALVRWNHPVLGVISPSVFIPVLESNGYITKLDQYIWEEVCKTIRVWIDEGIRPIPIAVNVTKTDVLAINVAEFFSDMLKKYRIPPKYLDIDIAKSAYLETHGALSETEAQLQQMGFRVILDGFDGDYVEFPDILHQCKKYGNYDMVYEFASTSKITFPGDGVACMATSEANLEDFEKWIGIQTISYDKVNQQRHVLYLQNRAHTLKLMKKHAAFMKPKFEAVLSTLDREIAPLEIASWSHPKGGYFVSFDAMPGTAKRTLALCKEAGVAMTAAGATFPYGIDPNDSNIRIAPSFPPVEDVEKAIAVFCTCVKMSALEKLGI